MSVPKIPNWIRGKESLPASEGWLEKANPHSGRILCLVADSSPQDVREAIEAATASFSLWSGLPSVQRGQLLFALVALLQQNRKEIMDCLQEETGKPPQDAAGEVAAAVAQGQFFAGEGMRLYGRFLNSGVPGKRSHTVREPRGVAGLIVPANTPLANVAWKAFPALICGNTVVLKASEDAPRVAQIFARLTREAGFPDGVFNVVQGRGQPAGATLVTEEAVRVISFTGSTEVGRWVAEAAGRRLARVSLELGGKNAFVVCDDANLDHAVDWATRSAFSNAGQRCASASRILVFSGVYREFRDRLIEKTRGLKLGVQEGCDLGPLIHARSRARILQALAGARQRGGKIIVGGQPPSEPELAHGFYLQPTLVEGLPPDDPLNHEELFGPVATLEAVRGLEEAVEAANRGPYGLTAAIHTSSIHKALEFSKRVLSGVVNINLGTFGSEPHMPFGGFGLSGNGTREPGVEALDVYSELKTVSWFGFPPVA